MYWPSVHSGHVRAPCDCIRAGKHTRFASLVCHTVRLTLTVETCLQALVFCFAPRTFGELVTAHVQHIDGDVAVIGFKEIANVSEYAASSLFLCTYRLRHAVCMTGGQNPTTSSCHVTDPILDAAGRMLLDEVLQQRLVSEWGLARVTLRLVPAQDGLRWLLVGLEALVALVPLCLAWTRLC